MKNFTADELRHFRALRVWAGKTQKEMAEDLGIGAPAYVAWEVGRIRRPGQKKLMVIRDRYERWIELAPEDLKSPLLPSEKTSMPEGEFTDEEIREWRALRRLNDETQDSISVKLGIKRGTVANWEIGRLANPSSEVVGKLRAQLKVWKRKGAIPVPTPDGTDLPKRVQLVCPVCASRLVRCVCGEYQSDASRFCSFCGKRL